MAKPPDPDKSDPRPGRESSGVQWDKFLKKYVWDDQKTPYFTPVDNLTRRQAEHEIFAYALFMGVLFAVFSLVSLAENSPYGRSGGASLYAFTVVCAAVILGVMRSYASAVYLGVAPAAVLVFLYMHGFSPKLGVIDQLVIVAVALLLVRYSFRLVALVRDYPDMPEGEAPPARRRRGPFG
ncbi:MAG: hypothetical protein ACR2RL_26720 [Gammaproteobacteria bacterium]